MKKIDVPYLRMRNGRPRWDPGPGLRARGFRAQDLRDDTGNWLSEGAAIDAARKLNAAAANGQPQPAAAASERTMNALFDLYLKSALFPESEATQRHYRSHISILRAWCGDIPAAKLSRNAIREFHSHAKKERGQSMANALLRVLNIALNYGVNELEGWMLTNRAAKMKPKLAEGRLVVWTPEEIATFVATADRLGLESQGDAVILGALTGQRRADILALPICDLEGGYYVIRQNKTGAKAFVPLTAPLRARLEAMRTRAKARWPNVVQSFELVSTETGHAYPDDGSAFHKEFRTVLAIAAGVPLAIENACRALGGQPVKLSNQKTCTSLAGKLFQDLRDTAVTWLCAAGCSVPEIANITGHSLKTVQQILDKHYFVRNAELAGIAGAKLDAYLKKVWA